VSFSSYFASCFFRFLINQEEKSNLKGNFIYYE
jgi:hypothetical protein